MRRLWCLFEAQSRLAAMTKYQQHALSRDKFLTVANNVLYKSLLETQRTSAKNIYNSVSDGKRVALMTIRMDPIRAARCWTSCRSTIHSSGSRPEPRLPLPVQTATLLQGRRGRER